MNRIMHISKSAGVMKALPLLIMMVAFSLPSKGQGFLDPGRDQQFLVGETGTTYLTPSEYYQLVEPDYYRTAALTNKLGLRGLFRIEVYKQEPKAKEIDSALVARAKIAALEWSDRMVDVAWLTEDAKLRKSLESINEKISKILAFGGSSKAKEEYEMRYKAIQTGIQAVQDGYQSNSMRKREYSALYRDAVKLDEELSTYMKESLVMKDVKPADSTYLRYRPNVAQLARQAQTKWKTNAASIR